MVSLAALVLTITMVVVQLAMGQFSPRIVQTFLRDKPSQFAVGLFVATFVHAMLTLREVQFGDGDRCRAWRSLVAYVLVVRERGRARAVRPSHRPARCACLGAHRARRERHADASRRRSIPTGSTTAPATADRRDVICAPLRSRDLIERPGARVRSQRTPTACCDGPAARRVRPRRSAAVPCRGDVRRCRCRPGGRGVGLGPRTHARPGRRLRHAHARRHGRAIAGGVALPRPDDGRAGDRPPARLPPATRTRELPDGRCRDATGTVRARAASHGLGCISCTSPSTRSASWAPDRRRSRAEWSRR